ncbi:hypothetical protein NXS19_010236 [Fusarium pseudograminearum]|nr:hypothetical protein NXS19_010236 [Fusarium pseudograminearum]
MLFVFISYCTNGWFVVCRRITATWDGKNSGPPSIYLDKDHTDRYALDSDWSDVPCKDSSDESALLAATVQVGLFWIPFSHFHFASSIHLCNGLLKLLFLYPPRTESNKISRYDAIPISITLK